ncbi:MAG TPA: peptidylprolyl isomerase, partial [Bacillota bacterium]|nr:peptidylprolyl isomerase [Bacillota bacterium]
QSGLVAEYTTALFALTEVGEISHPVKTELVYTDEEITAYYQQHLLDKYTQKDSSHILVADEATANLVYDKLVAGENFVALSDEYSTDTTAKANGGNIGYYGQSGLVAEYTTALFALTEVGEISHPVKTEFGWHIIRLDGIKVTPMSETIDTIKTDMVDNKTNAILRTVVEKANIRPTSAKSAMLGRLADK